MHGLSRINSSRQVSHFVQGWSKIQHVSVCLPVASKAGTHPILGFNQGSSKWCSRGQFFACSWVKAGDPGFILVIDVLNALFSLAEEARIFSSLVNCVVWHLPVAVCR
jgi:hypothetical protein